MTGKYIIITNASITIGGGVATTGAVSAATSCNNLTNIALFASSGTLGDVTGYQSCDFLEACTVYVAAIAAATINNAANLVGFSLCENLSNCDVTWSFWIESTTKSFFGYDNCKYITGCKCSMNKDAQNGFFVTGFNSCSMITSSFANMVGAGGLQAEILGFNNCNHISACDCIPDLGLTDANCTSLDVESCF